MARQVAHGEQQQHLRKRSSGWTALIVHSAGAASVKAAAESLLRVLRRSPVCILVPLCPMLKRLVQSTVWLHAMWTRTMHSSIFCGVPLFCERGSTLIEPVSVHTLGRAKP